MPADMYRLSGWRFDSEVSAVFDQHVRQSVPLYDAIQQELIHLSDFFVQNGEKVYDLGCATGETILLLNQRHRDKGLRFVGIDNSEAMLTKAKQKNQGSTNIELVTQDIQHFEFEESTHLVISLLTLQFLLPQDRKQVLRKVYDALDVGGSFLLVEKTVARTPHIQEVFTQIYHDFKEEQGLSEVEIRDKDKSLRGKMHLLSVHDNEQLLRDVGFSSVDVFFKCLNFTGFLAIK